jgi:hypothetical protein
MYRSDPLRTTMARWGVGFGSAGEQEVPGPTMEALRAAGQENWLYDTGKMVNILLQEDGNRLCHLEHAALLHIGGLSHYLSPPEKGGRGARCGRGAGPAVALAAGPAGGGPSHGVGASGAVRGAARSRGTVGPRRGSRRSAGLRAPRADRALSFERRSGRSRRRLGATGLRGSGDGVGRRPDPPRVLHHERDPTPSIDR